ncbi:MAG: exonuclease domain-containing protein [Pseudomonadota bacterium]
MFQRASLQTRIMLFFALIACAVPVVIGVSLSLAAQRLEGNPVPPLVLFGGLASAALMVIIGVVWQLFDANVAQPIQRLSRDLQTLLHANPNHDILTDCAKHLGPLAGTVDQVADAIRVARTDSEHAVSAAIAKADAAKGRLEAVLQNLEDGVIVCNRYHEVLLYNRRALQIVQDCGELGLARSLFDVMDKPPFMNTLERLTNRLTSGRYQTHRNGLSALFAFSSCDGRRVLRGTMTLLTVTDAVADEVADPGTEAVPKITGYVLTFDDQTEELQRRARIEGLLRSTVEDLRGPIADLAEACTALEGDDAIVAVGKGVPTPVLGQITSNTNLLSDRIAMLARDYDAVASSHWPMSDIYSANVLSIVASRYRDNPVIACDVSGASCWVHCDSHMVVELLSVLILDLVEHVGATTYALEADDGAARPKVSLVWKGSAPGDDFVSRVAEKRIGPDGFGLSVGDVLDHHRTHLTQEELPDGRQSIGLKLLSPIEPHDLALTATPPTRLEFYDFSLLDRPIGDGAILDKPLRELTLVVFDTETTGLEPSDGDEIISIAGVRVVNGRVLTGELFDAYVNPGRKIPGRSTAIHGISDEMVKDAPPISVMMRRFHEFVGPSVLVAHNAAFDLRFLELKKDVAGVSFDGPVLDTVLLSAIVHDHTDQHTLDAVCERLDVWIEPDKRHTALGDALATAEAFVRMIDLLSYNGIDTLRDALDASNRLVQIRRQQAKY